MQLYQQKVLAVTLVYVDATQGWLVTDSGYNQMHQQQYITATGGTITTCGDYKVHTFTGPGTFTVSLSGNPAGSNTVDYLVVAGGGGGGKDSSCWWSGGGGGVVLENLWSCIGCYTASPLGACVQLYQLQQQVIQLQSVEVDLEFHIQECNGSNSIFSQLHLLVVEVVEDTFG